MSPGLGLDPGSDIAHSHTFNFSKLLSYDIIMENTLTYSLALVFRQFLRQFSADCHEILALLFLILLPNTLKLSSKKYI